MLAELAAANAAFAVIKQAVSNGKEIAAAGNAIAEFVGAKEKLQAKWQRILLCCKNTQTLQKAASQQSK